MNYMWIYLLTALCSGVYIGWLCSFRYNRRAVETLRSINKASKEYADAMVLEKFVALLPYDRRSPCSKHRMWMGQSVFWQPALLRSMSL